MSFVDKLWTTSRRNRSLLCVGLDPDPSLMPLADIFEFNRCIIDATADVVCAYKPNMAFYEAAGLDGLKALLRTVEYVPDGIPVISDAKRGDIGNTARAYARSVFEGFGFDAVTVNPYLGKDALDPFFEYADRGVFVLCRTSNPGARDFQDLPVRLGEDEMPLYQAVALRAREWNTRGNVGLVVGATYPDEIARVRALCPDMPFLVPGVGAQGGDLEAAVRAGLDVRGRGVIVNVSRQVLYASKGPDFADAARLAAEKARDDINRYRPLS